VLRPIHDPALGQLLAEHGPGLHHVAFAMSDLPRRAEEIREKGVFLGEPFAVPQGWRIAYLNLERSGPALFGRQYDGDHVAEASPGL